MTESARSRTDVDLDTIAPEVVTGHIVCPRCGKHGDTDKGLLAHLAVVHGEPA